jgi:hypothetical protein
MFCFPCRASHRVLLPQAALKITEQQKAFQRRSITWMFVESLLAMMVAVIG